MSEILLSMIQNKFLLLSELSNSFESSNFQKSFDNELSKILKRFNKKIILKYLSFIK